MGTFTKTQIYLAAAKIIILVFINSSIHAAVMAPPWANPKLNPCANKPGGWQLLFWPPDGKCYKIFKIGYPCPDGMELSPIPMISTNQTLTAECRCPPKTSQYAKDGNCYQLFSKGPCDKGQYFSPDVQYNSNITTKRHWGICTSIPTCQNINDIFWPENSKCYEKFTRGPCPRGQLLTRDSHKIPVCKCDKYQELREFWSDDGNGCFQHYTKGPCKENGHLFLPDRTCGCHNFLPHYHDTTSKCFEIGTLGPCSPGELFQLDPTNQKGRCECKPGYIRFQADKTCYRPYTKGPCLNGLILVNSTTCIPKPCKKAELYFPQHQLCYQIGTRGPCQIGQVVTFDFNTRPSIDGISYNGVCNCEKSSTTCTANEVCDSSNNMVLFKHKCYKLYTQGPCIRGAWLVPQRHPKENIWPQNRKKAYCECMPGYTKRTKNINGKNFTECLSPTVILANYLNKNFITSKK